MNILILSCFAGVLGTSVGALFGILANTKQNSINNILALSGGCMVGMVFFSIYPEAQTSCNFINILLSSIFGITFLFFLNYLTSTSKKNKLSTLIKTCSSIERKSELFKAGIVLFIAISAHNIPEGIAISSLGFTDFKTAITLTILLFIHNIPEGMAIATPLVAGGMNKFKSFIFATLAGGATIIGGLIGLALININESLASLALSFSAGAMLNVTFCDIYPETFSTNKASTHIYNFIGMFSIYLLVNLI